VSAFVKTWSLDAKDPRACLDAIKHRGIGQVQPILRGQRSGAYCNPIPMLCHINRNWPFDVKYDALKRDALVGDEFRPDTAMTSARVRKRVRSSLRLKTTHPQAMPAAQED